MRAPARLAFVAAGLVFLTACSTHGSPYMFDPKGPEAHRITSVWWLMFTLAAVVYVVVAGFIFVAAFRGRRSETGKPSRITDNGFIVVGGIAVPFVILMVLAWATVDATNHVRRPEKNPLKIEVVGKRWWWSVEYPDQHFTTANEVHVPVGRPIELGLDAADVIHSFWVPQIGGKVDLIPGQHNVWRFKVDEPGTYRGQCAEYCGVQHAHMAFLVVAESPAAFDTWALRRENPPSGPTGQLEATGQMVFMRSPCAGCHTIRGTAATGTIGPDLTDVGSRKMLGAATVPNDEGHLAGWILDAQTIKPGALMPPISIEPRDLQALLAYLRSLK